MATFEVGKTYYFNHETIRKFKVVKKTKCYVWLVDYINKPDYTYRRKIFYLQQNTEEYVKIGCNIHLYSSCKWNRYWKIGKHPNGFQIVIKPDFTTFYKMNTATLKMFKFVGSMWGMGQCWSNNIIIDYEGLVEEMVEKNTDDYDEDYYCLYYTSNKDINWDMINTLMYRNMRIGENIKHKLAQVGIYNIYKF
jgi:hypothetical protein